MRFYAILWEHTAGESAWIFVTVPIAESEVIRSLPRPPKPGFGSVRVSATVGGSEWQTSVFPESTSGCYLLPIKRQIRNRESIGAGDTVAVQLRVLDDPAHSGVHFHHSGGCGASVTPGAREVPEVHFRHSCTAGS